MTERVRYLYRRRLLLGLLGMRRTASNIGAEYDALLLEGRPARCQEGSEPTRRPGRDERREAVDYRVSALQRARPHAQSSGLFSLPGDSPGLHGQHQVYGPVLRQARDVSTREEGRSSQSNPNSFQHYHAIPSAIHGHHRG